MGYEDRELTEAQEVLQGLVIEDIAADFRNLLVALGFTEVSVTELESIPMHAVFWMGEGMGPDELRAAIEEADRGGSPPRYWNVRTRQGDFGIFRAGMPLLDLSDSGVRVHQLVPTYDADSEFPFCILSQDALKQLRKLFDSPTDFELVDEQGTVRPY